MKEPPSDVPDGFLRAALAAHYGLAVTGVTFLSLGHDSSAWVYRVDTASTPVLSSKRPSAGPSNTGRRQKAGRTRRSYFLKVHRQAASPPGLLVPRHLHDRGLTQVVPPLPTNTQALSAEAEGHTLVLYPFVDGRTGMEAGLTPRQWSAYGALLRQVHGTILPAGLAQRMPRENFIPTGAGLVRELAAHIGGRTFADPSAQALAAFWQEHRTVIDTLVERAEDLGGRLAASAPTFVLCHADIHTGNVLLGVDGQLRIVDWDETVFAPKERDLMFVVGGIRLGLVSPRKTQWFFRGYGEATVDPLALAYYRYAWAVGDIAAYGAQVFLRPDLGDVTKRAAAELFQSLFLPGHIVEIAGGV